MSKLQWMNELKKEINKGTIRMDEPLRNYTKTKLGGTADIFIMPATFTEMKSTVRYAFDHDIPLLLLGNGSNMVVRDGGVRGIVLHMAHLNTIRIDGTKVYAEAGAQIMDVSKKTAAASLTGFEFACGIPGTVGGAMVMNAGAYGGEMKDVVVQTTVMDRTGEIFTLSKEELHLGYRQSVIAEKGYFVLYAEFVLAHGQQAEIDAKIADLTKQRASKQPLEYPSAGSVFKRPPGYFAGKLIQDSGLQGKGFGGAEVSTKHAGFIVNKNNATATDYIQTIEMVREEVKKQFGVDLELEVKIVGED